MPRNLKFDVNYGGARIHVNSTHDQGLDLRVQGSTADRQGRREHFCLEFGNPGAKGSGRVSGSRYIESDECTPNEDGFQRETRDGRMRGLQQSPPDGSEVGWHEATNHSTSARPRPSLRGAATTPHVISSSSRRSEVPDASYNRPRRASTSRSSTGPGYGYALPAQEPTHDMGGDRVEYIPGRSTTSTRAFGSGRIERPRASESFHHLASQPRSHSPPISATSPNPRHEASRNSYYSADPSSYSVSSSGSRGTVVAAPDLSSSPTRYHGGEMILYGADRPGPPSSYCSHQSGEAYEPYQRSLECSDSTCDYYDDDDGGGVYVKDDGGVWPDVSYSCSDSEDTEWSDGRTPRAGPRSGSSRRY